jgi:hypothetical protein
VIKLLESLFGCLHQRVTFPQSPRRVGSLNRFQRRGPTHVTCLGCGQEFLYDWAEMRVGPKIVNPAINPIECLTAKERV